MGHFYSAVLVQILSAVDNSQIWVSIGHLIARGYEPPALPEVSLIWITVSSARSLREVPQALLLEELQSQNPPEIVVMLHRGDARLQSNQYQLIMDQIALASDSAICVFSLQFQGARRSQALNRIYDVMARVLPPNGVRAISLCLPASRKAASINCTLELIRTLSYRGVGWVDDDIELEEACLARMIEGLREREFLGAVRPTKIPHLGDNLGSKLLYHVKTITKPATNYPHGCCILVSANVIRDGIPSRYMSDDGYVCFSLLRPEAALPEENLEVLSNCAWHYVVGAPKGKLLLRIKRLLINHFVFICDYPTPVGKYYLRTMLFHGFWPIGRFDWSMGVLFGLAKWGLKLIYFLWFSFVGIELLIRGIFCRLIRQIPWGEGLQRSTNGSPFKNL